MIDDREELDPRVWKVAAVVLLGPFMTQLDSTVVNVSLATIRLELRSSIASAQWIISGYLLALALMLPLSGWLVDRLGAKRLYLACFSAFTLASLLCGAARTMDELIAVRVLQGMAGGLLAPMTQMMIARVAGKQIARVLGYAVVPVLIAPIVGPVVAGMVLKYAPWPWLFYLNLPIGIVAVGLAALLLPRDEETLEKRPFDLFGFLTFSPGLSPTRAGWMLASIGLGMMISFPLMGFLTGKFGCRAISASGALVALLGMLPFLWMIDSRFSVALTVTSLLVLGAGRGAIGIPSMSAAYASVAREQLAVATTALNIVQRLGGPLATTITATALALSAIHHPAVGARAFLIAFVLLTGLHVLTLGAAIRLPVRVLQRPKQSR